MDFRRVAARLTTMEVDSPDDENHSPCYQRLKLKGRIATVKMRLKTFHELQATFNTSNPSLMETTSAAAEEHQVKLDALVSERDSLPECLTFNCQFCNNSNPTTPVEVNAPIKNKNSHINKKAKTDKNFNKTPVNDKNKTAKIENTNGKKKFKKRKIKKDSVEDFVFPLKTARPASPSNSEQIAIANNFSDLTVDQNQVIEEKEAKIADIPNPRPLQPIHLKITKILETKLNLSIKNSQKLLTKHQRPAPIFLITLPRNASNSKIFDIKTLGYLQVRVEGFLVRGITQCYNCNNFFHTASECRLKPRCLKCGKEHPTKQCPIKERQENPFCINCKEHGHSACYTKCPLFPKPKKGTTLPMISKTKINKCKEGITYANVVSGRDSPLIPTPNASGKIQQCECKNSSKGIHGIIQDNNSDLAQVIELISIISKILKRSPEILQMLKNLKSAEDDHSKSYLLVEALLDEKDI
ncbi:uncharacterized protein TNCV_2481381 [Trichonephila clavipes]|nr:uncharacterized protein TNCV_2481381 [Trichonephila clavipes]